MDRAFDRNWLELREPADARARDRRLLAAAAGGLAEAGCIVVDLGAGTGATVRAMAPRLRAPVRWRLVDHDQTLLQAAVSSSTGAAIETVALDLARVEDLPLADAGFVTASALFDLCSRSFIEALAGRLAQRRLGLYAALTYDGRISWEPAQPDDDRMLDLFNAHQASDKGFGPALGPAAAGALIDTLGGLGYRLAKAPSPWRLGSESRELQSAFIEGMAGAVGELQAVEPAILDRWLRSRLAAVSTGALCRVGHLDILALPPGPEL